MTNYDINHIFKSRTAGKTADRPRRDGGRIKQGSNCFTPDAVRQRFVPVTELIMRERMAESYKATLRSLDAELRREAAAW